MEHEAALNARLESRRAADEPEADEDMLINVEEPAEASDEGGGEGSGNDGDNGDGNGDTDSGQGGGAMAEPSAVSIA